MHALLSKMQMEESFCFIYVDLCAKIITHWLTTDVSVKVVKATSNNDDSSITKDENDFEMGDEKGDKNYDGDGLNVTDGQGVSHCASSSLSARIRIRSH